MKSSEKREFLKLISIDEAQRIIFGNFKEPLIVETVPLENAKNRILMEDIVAPLDIPPFDRSRMDGYAVRADDTYAIEETEPGTFSVIDSIKAGETSDKIIKEPFTCIEIATGAVIPKGANSVVMVEYTSSKNDGTVEIFRPVSPQENIESAGSDIMYGETVIRVGQLISSVHLGILAALGISEIKVLKKINVGVLSTGNELRRPTGQTLESGCIYDSNSIILRNLLHELGTSTIDYGVCPDDMDEMKKVVKKALDEVDILVMSGGTSAGEGDYSYRVITELGGNQLFHGVSSKPGKPLSAGIIKNKLIVTLPGFPSSAIFSFNTVIAPLIRQWSKNDAKDLPQVKAVVGLKINNDSGRTQFKLVHLLKDENTNIYRLFPVKGSSGSVSVLEKADGFITIPSNVSILSSGDYVNVTLFQNEVTLSDLVFVGSHDFVIDRLFREFRKLYPQYRTKLVFVGSSGGLASLNRNECDLAGSHLLDEETGEYNISFIKKLNLMDRVEIIQGYYRIQGLFIAKGNPKNIKGIIDLLRPDIRFMNRTEGSGTRVLLDSLLKKLLTENKDFHSFEDIKKHINGYQTVASSHSATVNAVARGVIDVSIGIKSYANLFDVDFIPLTDERYDLVMNKNSLNKPEIKSLLDLFTSKEFRKLIDGQNVSIKWVTST